MPRALLGWLHRPNERETERRRTTQLQGDLRAAPRRAARSDVPEASAIN